MNKTKIEWCDYTWNPIKGYCPNNCPYCYAHRMYNRFKWNKRIRLDLNELQSIKKMKSLDSKRIFIGSTIDIFNEKIDTNWLNLIVVQSLVCQQHRYFTLSKCYENQRIFFRYYDPPLNWWRGLTITGLEWFDRFSPEMYTGRHSLFLSIEPLLSPIKKGLITKEIKWIIIGGLTPKPVHNNQWIRDVVDMADFLSIPVFIKDNAQYPIARKEYPCQEP